MERTNSCLCRCTVVSLFCLTLSFSFLFDSAQAVTASFGQPYRGRLVSGIPFPRQFQGYQLREEDRTYTTPELVGAVLDAIEGVLKEYPTTCDLYFGDFSRPGGGFLNGHRSHQNGRDVDLGMYAKDNRLLDSLMLMNEENLDVPKTWCLVEGLLRSQRVQYIFLDRRIQRLLYDYASSKGVDPAYLERLFGDGRAAVIRHLGNHQDHLHVRFYSPWSTMAAQLSDEDDQKRKVVELAQQAYLPKKVNYYVNGNERGLESLAQSFGVSRKDLCKWNQIHGNDILAPGACLVFYKRGFEIEPVHLAQSLRADSIPETAGGTHVVSLRPTRSLSDVSSPLQGVSGRERRSEGPVITRYTVRRGDTLAAVARANRMDVKALCELNGFRAKTALRPGQKIKLVSTKATGSMDTKDASGSPGLAKRSGKSDRAGASVAEKSPPVHALHTVSKGENLASIGRLRGVDVGTLCSLNGLRKNSRLCPGQTILLARVGTSVRDVGGGSLNEQASSTAKVQGQGKGASKQQIGKVKVDVPKQAAKGTISNKKTTATISSKAKSAPVAKTSPGSMQKPQISKEKAPVSVASKGKSSSPSKGASAKKNSSKPVESKKSSAAPSVAANTSKVASKKKVN